MTTGYTKAAVSLYRGVESSLATLEKMLHEIDVQRADQLTLTTLRGVAKRLDEVEEQWNEALWIAEAERREADAADERETQDDVRYGGCQ